MRRQRFFYLPNELHEGDQIGPRKAFRLLHEEGTFSSNTAYSYLVERQRARTQGEALEALYPAAAAFAPDLIYRQHRSRSYPIERRFLQRLNALPSRPRFVWNEKRSGPR